MADSFSPKFRFRLMEDGSHINTWGQETNENYPLIEEAIAGAATITSVGGSYSLTTNNDASDEARCAILIFTATLTSNLTVTIPSTSKLYVVRNATSGAFTLTIKTSSGSGILIAQGATTFIACDGTNCFTVSPDRLTSDIIGNDKVLSQITLKDIGETEYNLGSIAAGTLTLDYTNGGIQYGTLTGNITLALPTNFPAGGGVLALKLKQDASGSRLITLNSSYEKKGTITLSTTANKSDVLYIFKIAGVYHITIDAGYA